ncbi:MAG: SNF2-related protein, partial [Akkermansiaceae bacterium]|nr:SNF2-related protein [Akkermansiaceae bacterium]
MNAPAWTEAMLRAAASWQAFKEGARLVSAAAVAASGPDGYRGTVRSGGRAHQTRVTVHSASHLEVRCSCAENQASGAVCAHAVALGLAALRSAAVAPGVADRIPAPAAVAVEEPAPAWCVEFPPNWQEALAKGRLAPVLRHATGPAAEPVSHDRQLTAWLRTAGCTPEKSPQHLHLAGDSLSEFLGLLCDHPRVATRSEPLAVTANGRLPLRALTLCDDAVSLTADDDPAIIGCGGTLWRLAPGQLVRLHPTAAKLPRQLPLARFLEQLDVIQAAFAVPDDCFIHRLRFVAAPFAVLMHLDGNLQALRATLTVRYDDRHPPLAPGQPGDTGLPRLEQPDFCRVRDSEGESTVVRMLVGAGFQPPSTPADGWRLTAPDTVIRFLTQNLPTLKQAWTVTESAALAKARSGLTLVRPAISIISSGEDWLQFDLSFEADDGRVFSHADVQRLLRSGRSGAAVKTIASNDIADVLNPLLAELDLRQEGGHFTANRLAGAVIQELVKKQGKELTSRSLDLFAEEPFPAAIRAVPRSYQRQGVAWLNDRLKRYSGALLADDMGLGKTLQTIALIELLGSEAAECRPLVLVVVPTSLLGNWAAEFARFAPDRVVYRLHGGGREGLRERVGPGAVVLTSFATLPRDLAWHLRQVYDLVVVDEASQMRNPETDHAKALCKLNARRRLALSGTPVENSVRDLWSIFRFLLPGWLGERSEFRERYEVPLAATPPDPGVLARLRVKTAPF